MRHLNTKILVAADSGARWGEWSEARRGYVTVGELTPLPEPPQDGPRDAASESDSGQPHGGGDPPAARLARERFAELLAQSINADVAAGHIDRLVVVAPPLLLQALKANLSTAALGRLAL